MHRKLMAATLTAAVLSASVPAFAAGQSCFFVNQWEGWKAVDDHTIYLRISVNDIYRLDLANACPEIRYPGARLINHDHGGSGSICDALDWDLRVSEGPPAGIATPCIVKSMTHLSPAEAAAIPKDQRP